MRNTPRLRKQVPEAFVTVSSPELQRQHRPALRQQPTSFNSKRTPDKQSSPSLSAYNPFTATPPRLECEPTAAKHNPVTKSQLLLQRIDPDALCATLSAMGR